MSHQKCSLFALFFRPVEMTPKVHSQKKQKVIRTPDFMNEAHAEDTVNHQAGKGNFTKLSTFMDVKSKQT